MVKTKQSDQIDVMFRAFSDRTRLRLLNLLQRGETCVCDLVEVLELPQPKISRHLAYLRRAGLVTARKDGLWMHYQLATAKTEFHKSLLNCLACCFRTVPELKKDSQHLKMACSTGCRPDGSAASNCCG
jgi:ArsR family transcriptional regulator